MWLGKKLALQKYVEKKRKKCKEENIFIVNSETWNTNLECDITLEIVAINFFIYLDR